MKYKWSWVCKAFIWVVQFINFGGVWLPLPLSRSREGVWSLWCCRRLDGFLISYPLKNSGLVPLWNHLFTMLFLGFTWCELSFIPNNLFVMAWELYTYTMLLFLLDWLRYWQNNICIRCNLGNMWNKIFQHVFQHLSLLPRRVFLTKVLNITS